MKSESEAGKTSYGTVREKFQPMYLLLADTVLVSVRHSGGVRSTEYRPVYSLLV